MKEWQPRTVGNYRVTEKVKVQNGSFMVLRDAILQGKYRLEREQKWHRGSSTNGWKMYGLDTYSYRAVPAGGYGYYYYLTKQAYEKLVPLVGERVIPWEPVA